MISFTSSRERKLWTWALILVAGIYATLGLASTLAEYLYNQGLSAIALLSVMALIALTIVIQALQTRPSGPELGVGIGIAAVYFMVLFRMTMPERSHLIEYSVVAVFIYEALRERARNGGHVPLVPSVTAFLLTSLFGVLDEFIQLVLPNRHFEWIDIVFNGLAAAMAVGAMVALGWARWLAGRIKKSAP